MSQTPEKEDPVLSARFSPGSSSSFDKMVHDATKSVLSEGAGNGNITALSVATGQMAMSPTTPTLNERSHNDAYISPVETLTFSPSNENNIGMSTNPDQVIITEKNSGVNVTSPVVANSFDFMSTSLVTDKSGDVEATVTTEERAAEAYTTDDIAIGKSSSTTLTPTATDTDTENAEKIGITKSLSTCPTGLGSENDDPANESGINMLRRVNRLCRPAWLWVFVVSVLAFAIAIVAIVGANMMKEKDSNADSINGIGLGNTLGPTLSPTTAFPSESPSESPSFGPTLTVGPSDRPSISPTSFPTTAPSFAPTNFPTVSAIPSDAPSEIPTQFPSASPSSAPTDLPSTTPSDIPSTVPSKAPTIAPTGNPTISSAPTVETHVLLMELLNNITDTPLQVLDDPSTPQGRALLWMATEDKVVMDLVHTAVVGEEAAMVVPMTDTDNATNALTPPAPVSAPGGLSPEVLFHLPQRYAVVTLDLSLHANSDILWSFPNLHECEWPGVICDRSEEIIAIDWARQNLTGYVAPEVSLLTELERLDLAQNQLTGFVDVFWNLPQLKTLYLHENQFMGPIGTEIGNLYNLEELYLGNNQLTGRIPEEVFELDDLRYLILNHNSFSGALPSRVRMNDLYYFDLSHNALNGTLPSTLRMASLRHFSMAHNQFSGSIPSDYSNLGSNRLFQFYLNDNQLSGGFPGNWHTKLPHKFLTNVDVSNNRLTQNMPSSVCMLSVYEEGETVEFRADCDVCNCGRLCYRSCQRGAKDYHNY